MSRQLAIGPKAARKNFKSVRDIHKNQFSAARHAIFRFFALTVLSAVFCVSITARTLKDYRESIVHLKADFASLLSEARKNDDEREPLDYEIFREALAMLPSAERVEYGDKSFEINNVWLSQKIRDFRNEPGNSERKPAILLEIYERLEAIELKIVELETAAAATQTKDQNKRKIAEILNREEFQKPSENEAGFLSRMLDKFREWLANLFPRPEISPKPAPGFQSFARILQILLYGLVIGVIGFILYRFGPFILKRFGRNQSAGESERIVLGEKISGNETPATLFSEAERLAGKGDLKGAIRKGYIALLFDLSDRKLLGIAKHKTNRDYLADLRARRELHENMMGLTGNYERHWYGFDPVTIEDWEEFKTGYKNALGNS